MPGRSDKIRDSDPGITIGGVPLEEHIKEEERNELEDTRKQEIGTKTKTKKKIRPKEKFEDDPRKVSKRVRRLSDWEIRKEYGVKAKPFSSLTKNVFYCIFSAGDTLINSRAISDELGRPLPDVSSSLSNIYKKLKDDGMIYRKKTGLAYNYCMTNEGLAVGFEELYQKYFPGPGGYKKKPKEEPIPEPKPDERSAARFRGINKRMEALAEGVFKRIEALEQDGLDRKVQVVDNQLQELANNFKRYKQGISADIREIFDLENKPPGEFNINFNVRFMFGGR